MAHAIAEKIERVEKKQSDEKTTAINDCAALVLSVWSHRNELPNGKRPFESFEPIFRVLESLDEQSGRVRYFGMLYQAVPEPPEQPATETWANRAKELDETARSVIKYCLVKAGEAAAAGMEPLLKLAADVKTAEDLDLEIVFHIVGESEKQRRKKATAFADQIINERIEKLEKLVSVSQGMIADLKNNLSTAHAKRVNKPKSKKSGNSRNTAPK